MGARTCPCESRASPAAQTGAAFPRYLTAQTNRALEPEHLLRHRPSHQPRSHPQPQPRSENSHPRATESPLKAFSEDVGGHLDKVETLCRAPPSAMQGVNLLEKFSEPKGDISKGTQDGWKLFQKMTPTSKSDLTVSREKKKKLL